MAALDTWPAEYQRSTIRAETRAMGKACVDVLVSSLPPGTIRAVHCKGSAVKPWDSAIDYVPGLSDVDVHVVLADDRDESHLAAIDVALEVNAAVLAAYRRLAPSALHLPKPQLVIANRLYRDPGILPSPAATVETIYGEAYEDRELTPDEQLEQRTRDRDQLIRHLDFVAELPLRAIDRPGEHLTPLLGELNWRVSPVAPRVVEILGVPYAEAWSWNRTRLVLALRERELLELADAYEAYYRAGWRLFLEGSEGGAALDVLRAGATVVRLGAEFAASSTR